ncbi:MAG: hypothetical protein J07HQW2_00826 [Haloquadratum walsbyi J07HQW2]|jgi:hypothetical protein|uniref:Major facilitator superfamily (MFS) profile domain-containing protein n=1 Tax=Haloquadratum walsbyi J07HQW2 TaxID=1238425 RepID=U1PL39_9EURY|nr:MAG: hypothetical protein J07HQW2_00826 [Haloquadratum walsbyi J07HQW2]
MPGSNKAIFNHTPPGTYNFTISMKQVGVTAGSGVSALLVTRIASVFLWKVGFYVAAANVLVVATVFWLVYWNDDDGQTARVTRTP